MCEKDKENETIKHSLYLYLFGGWHVECTMKYRICIVVLCVRVLYIATRTLISVESAWSRIQSRSKVSASSELGVHDLVIGRRSKWYIPYHMYGIGKGRLLTVLSSLLYCLHPGNTQIFYHCGLLCYLCLYKSGQYSQWWEASQFQEQICQLRRHLYLYDAREKEGTQPLMRNVIQAL